MPRSRCGAAKAGLIVTDCVLRCRSIARMWGGGSVRQGAGANAVIKPSRKRGTIAPAQPAIGLGLCPVSNGPANTTADAKTQLDDDGSPLPYHTAFAAGASRIRA